MRKRPATKKNSKNRDKRIPILIPPGFKDLAERNRRSVAKEGYVALEAHLKQAR